MPLTSGTQIGTFRIIDALGAGGMGEVYRAFDPRLGRQVAIKVLPAAFSHDADRLRRFEQEARAAGQLNHPNITAVHDVGSFEGSPYLVTELLEGETLRQRLAGRSPSLRKALEYGAQIAVGLAAAHDKGIVHRDLKPDNVFVTKDGRIKILDFGLAKLATEQPVDDAATVVGQATAFGRILGTPGYMSPEQARGLPADARADIFSLGAMLYEMLTGQSPFRRATPADTVSAILRDEPEFPRTNAMPPPVERMVRHCLEKDPQARFQNARDLVFALESLSESPTAITTPIGRRQTIADNEKHLIPVQNLGLQVFLNEKVRGAAGESQRLPQA